MSGCGGYVAHAGKSMRRKRGPEGPLFRQTETSRRSLLRILPHRASNFLSAGSLTVPPTLSRHGAKHAEGGRPEYRRIMPACPQERRGDEQTDSIRRRPARPRQQSAQGPRVAGEDHEGFDEPLPAFLEVQRANPGHGPTGTPLGG